MVGSRANAAKKKAPRSKRNEHYAPKVKTDLSFEELIAMAAGKPIEKKD